MAARTTAGTEGSTPTAPPNAAMPGAPMPSSVSAAPAAGSATVAVPGTAGVPDQLVTVLAPLRAGLGVHSVSLGLQPDGLGTVQATVSVDAQQVVVSLWAGSEAGHAALARALPELHDHLALGAGQRVVVELASFGSAQPDARGAGRHGNRRQARAGSAGAPVGTVGPAGPGPVLVGAPATAGARTIDLHL